MKILSINWLPGTLLLLLWPKKLQLGTGIGVGYKLSDNVVGKKEIHQQITFPSGRSGFIAHISKM